MATGAGRDASPTDVADTATVRPAWLKPRTGVPSSTDVPTTPDLSVSSTSDTADFPSAPAADASGSASSPRSSAGEKRRRRTPARSPVPLVAIEPPSPSLPKSIPGWTGWLLLCYQSWWSGVYAGWGLTVSLLLHSAACVVLGLVFFSASSQRGALVSGTFDVAQDGEGLEMSVDTRLDTSFGDSVLNETFVPAAGSDAAIMEPFNNLLGSGQGEGDDEGGDGGGSSMLKNIRVPDSAITRGSFTVWTEPEDPAPRQSYDIVIQVKAPKGMKQFKLNDLSGRVIGTDGYRKEIKYSSKERRGVKDGVVQLTIRIPGAATLVKDVIEIRSKVLKEEQRIEIIF